MTTKRSAPLAAAASSTRRAFLKFGALAAAPLAAAAPALASGDDTADRLARLEDKEAIRALHAALLRAINTGDPAAARALFADPAKAELDPTIRAITLDHSAPAASNSSPAERGRWLREAKTEGASPGDLAITLAEDRQTATLAAACTVHTETPIDSNCTLVQMARLQGEGFTRAASPRTLEARFVKQDGAWKVESAGFA